MANPVPTIVFQVNLALLNNESIGPVTNSVTTGVLSPDQYQVSPDNGVVENANRKSTRSSWLPSLQMAPNVDLHDGDRFTEYGQRAVYLRDTYGIGYAPADRAYLTVVSVS